MTTTHETGHTPGPWRVKTRDLSTVGDKADIQGVIGPDGRSVCTMVAVSCLPDAVALRRANARLIASTPDMLSILREADELLATDHEEPGAWCDDQLSAREERERFHARMEHLRESLPVKIRALLARIEGRTV